MNRTQKVRVPWFQPLSIVRDVLKVYDGVSQVAVKRYLQLIRELTGTPQQTLDWSDPDQWIDQRMDGDMAELAKRFWVESNHNVNPRYVHGPDHLIRTYELAKIDDQGIYRHTELGRQFIELGANAIRRIDDGEGMLRILTVLSAKTQGRFGDIYPEWASWVRENSAFQADSSIKQAMRGRIKDLIERGYIERDGQVYSITQAGLDWLGDTPDPDPAQNVLKALKAYNDSQRDDLRDRLSSMNPYKFEELVGELLGAMGYEDVQVTKQSGDKGVDVVATIQFGITTVTEVVQVKRYQGSISRDVLDQLRGALPYHKALRGTIITTGKFSQGCKDAALFPGAAPIGLIDGERLLDLLFEHRIGIQGRSAVLFDVDESYFDSSLQGDSDASVDV